MLLFAVVFLPANMLCSTEWLPGIKWSEFFVYVWAFLIFYQLSSGTDCWCDAVPVRKWRKLYTNKNTFPSSRSITWGTMYGNRLMLWRSEVRRYEKLIGCQSSIFPFDSQRSSVNEREWLKTGNYWFQATSTILMLINSIGWRVETSVGNGVPIRNTFCNFNIMCNILGFIEFIPDHQSGIKLCCQVVWNSAADFCIENPLHLSDNKKMS